MILYPAPTTQNLATLKTIFSLFDRWCLGYHLDYMDGHFVSQTRGSIEFINQAQKYTHHPLWIHIMSYHPEVIISHLHLKRTSIVTVHYEVSSAPQLIQIAQKLTHMNLQSSLAINPQTDWQEIIDLIPFFDQILVMSVEPGASGQLFIPNIINKIKSLIVHINNNNLTCAISVDGGINIQTLPLIIKAGASSCALSSALFTHKDPLYSFQLLTDQMDNRIAD